MNLYLFQVNIKKVDILLLKKASLFAKVHLQKAKHETKYMCVYRAFFI